MLVAAIGLWLVFIPADVFHWHLLPPPGSAVPIAGMLVLVTGYAIMLSTLFQNVFAAPIVADQSKRGQELVETGIYACVRRPFYSGLLVFFAGLALWLESYAALLGLLPVLLTLLLLLRIAVEEKALRAMLPAHAEYAKKLRHRLLPVVCYRCRATRRRGQCTAKRVTWSRRTSRACAPKIHRWSIYSPETPV